MKLQATLNLKMIQHIADYLSQRPMNEVAGFFIFEQKEDISSVKLKELKEGKEDAKS